MADLLITGDPPLESWMNGYQSVDHSLVEALANHPEVATDYFGEHRDETSTTPGSMRTTPSGTTRSLGSSSRQRSLWPPTRTTRTGPARTRSGSSSTSPATSTTAGTATSGGCSATSSALRAGPHLHGRLADRSGIRRRPRRLGIESTTDQWNKFIAQAVQDDEGLAMVATALTSEIERIRDSRPTRSTSTGSRATTRPPPRTPRAGTTTRSALCSRSSRTPTPRRPSDATPRRRSSRARSAASSTRAWSGRSTPRDPEGPRADRDQGTAGPAVDSAVDPDKMPPLPDGFDEMRNYADNSANALRNDPPFQPYNAGTSPTPATRPATADPATALPAVHQPGHRLGRLRVAAR